MKNPDPGHKETDALLKDMEDRVSAVYSQAVKETQEKLDDYLRRFDTKDKIWQGWVESGKKTKEEYQQWRIGQIAMGDRWKQMRDTLAEDYHNANVIARSTVKGYMPDAYASGHNYATYQVEHGARVDTSYTLYDHQSVERIMRDEPDLLKMPGQRKLQEFADFDAYKAGKPVELTAEQKRAFDKLIAGGKDIRWQEGQIQSVTLQSILQGESIPNMARRIARTMGETNHKATIRYARTAMTGAENAGRQEGYERAVDMGIPMEKVWVATLDNRTRHEHRILDGQTVPVDEPFEVEGMKIMYPGDPSADASLIWNCFPGNTNVAADSKIVSSYKHKYSGDLIEIETATGAHFACTPNHPVLTPNGWVVAARLHSGDNILVAKRVNMVNPWGYPCVYKTHTSIKAVHHFLRLFGNAERVSPLRVNFHGDIPASDVEIVSKKRLLMVNRDIGIFENFYKFIFKFTNSLISCLGHFVSCLRGIYISFLSLVRGESKPLPFFGRGMRHSDVHRFRPVADMDIAVAEYSIDNLPAETEIRSKLLDGLSGKVFLDHVISVKIVPFSGHVYNLQTDNGYYFVTPIITNKRGSCNSNMPIVKNCRCTTISQIKGFERDLSDLGLRKSDKLGDMTYEEWKQGKATSLPITAQEEAGQAARSAYIREYQEGNGFTGSGEGSTIINGQDISETWQRRPDEFDFAIEDVINAQGFDGLPRVVSAEEFDEAVRAANNGEGFIAQRTYSAPDQETLDMYRDQLYNGKWYVDCSTGGAQYGQGMYCAADYEGKLTDGIKAEMEHYKNLGESRTSGGVSYTETLTLDPSAKVISSKGLDVLRESTLMGIEDKRLEATSAATTRVEAREIEAFWSAKYEYIYRMDDGAFAAMLGYDAINAEGHGKSGSYTVILNRTKVIIRGE